MDAVGNPSRTETGKVSMDILEGTSGTYTLRSLNMLNQHHQLLFAHETLETGVIRIIGILLNNPGCTLTPNNILSLREQVLHQLILAGKLDLNMALTKTTTTATGAVGFEAVNSSNGLVEVDEFNIAVQSLACDALHNDVDGLVFLLVNQAGITS